MEFIFKEVLCLMGKATVMSSVSLRFFPSKLALSFKGIVHPKMKTLSSLTHRQVVPNIYKFLQPNTKEDILKNFGNLRVDG